MNPRESNDSQQTYFVFQAIGWTSLFIMFTIFGFIFNGIDWKIVVNYINVSAFGFAISHAYRRYIKKHGWQHLKMGKLIVRVIIASPILSLIWQIFIIPVSYLLFGSEQPLSLGIMAMLTVNLSIIFFVWGLIYFLYKLFKSYKQSEIERWRLRSAVKDAQLIALKSQINPHFIFNSLNNIRSLVIENPEKARDMITNLSGLLRYSIQFNNSEKVTIEDEIGIVKNYLNLESIQLEDRLKFILDIADNTRELKIPPMSIQMLVENAIKHGISQIPGGGVVEIYSRIENSILVIEVKNTGQLKEKDVNSTGIGLKNATERLKLLFGRFSDLDISNLENGMVRARFTIPLN